MAWTTFITTYRQNDDTPSLLSDVAIWKEMTSVTTSRNFLTVLKTYTAAIQIMY